MQVCMHVPHVHVHEGASVGCSARQTAASLASVSDGVRGLTHAEQTRSVSPQRRPGSTCIVLPLPRAHLQALHV